MTWKILIDAQGRSGVENMRRDEALLDEATRAGCASLRLYRWDPPTLSIGRNQSMDGLPRDAAPVVRRPTGGTAVWHEHELTYAVAAPIAVFGSLRNAYCEIHRLLATAVGSLGVDCFLAPARRQTGTPLPDRPVSCFAVSTGGEIIVNGRKLVGSAQVRRSDAFLQHGSMLLDGSQAVVAPSGGEITLTEVLRRPVTFEEIAAAIVSIWPSDIASLVAR